MDGIWDEADWSYSAAEETKSQEEEKKKSKAGMLLDVQRKIYCKKLSTSP